MSLEALVDSLLYEGYALYPYTPGATKNATPTPFGIVYPPAYARALDTTYDHLELQCVAEGGGEVTDAMVEVARNAGRALTRAGANVTYRELDDLSHCYPREVNADVLAWLATPR